MAVLCHFRCPADPTIHHVCVIAALVREMFTGNLINLGSVVGGTGVDVVRDGEFSYIGKGPTNLPRCIVPASKPEQIEAAIAAEGVVGIITKLGNEALVSARMSLKRARDKVPASTRSLHP